MSRRKMIGAHVAPKHVPKRNANGTKERLREFGRAYDEWAKKPGRTHLAFTPAQSGVRVT